MKWLESRVLWGLLLILAGILFLLENLGVLRVGGLFWFIMIGLIGVYMIGVFISDRSNWWALIPGVILLTLSAVILLNMIFPGRDWWSGPLILAGIGLSFFLVYLAVRSFWWAVIPGGLMFTLSAVSLLESLTNGVQTGGIFFLGLGLTFGLVGALPVPEDGSTIHLRWAFIPAVILILIGVLISAASANLFNYIWPVILILIGIYFIYRTFARRSA